jgi:hypothetical protein
MKKTVYVVAKSLKEVPSYVNSACSRDDLRDALSLLEGMQKHLKSLRLFKVCMEVEELPAMIYTQAIGRAKRTKNAHD